MAAIIDRNRLHEAHSPYLRQHADNPVNWQPWDSEARAAAREDDRPIFLSIGYSACHWCHVMEDESFQNEAIAASLNERFVPIKVDREERPDLDRIYQTVCQLVTGSGGWPLSVWLTPDERPFYVGTYFPPRAGRGRPGFGDLLERISESWEQDRSAIEERADQWIEAARNELESTEIGRAPASHEEGEDTLIAAANAAVRSADREHGGFGTDGPKFPQAQRVELLLHAATLAEESSYEAIATQALDAMASRGLYDHIGGGFHRYATDRAWRVPHFEKMLYDNAELARVYVNAYQRTGREAYADVVTDTLDFVERELRHPDGGFYSTLDAQSEGREGAFYVWRPEEVARVLDDRLTADLICDRYGITESGNFEGGTSVLAISAEIEALAERYDLDVDEVRSRLASGNDALFRARAERERPRRDEKVLAGWNGLMISSLAAAGLVLDERYRSVGADALAFIKEQHWDAGKHRLSRRYLDGEVGVDGYLDDYAYLARAAFDLHQSGGDVEPLAFAGELTRVILEEFWDPEAGALFYTPESGESLVSRPQDLPDQSTPSSVGVAIDVLARMHHFYPTEGFDEIARQAIDTHRSRIRSAPLQHATLVQVDKLVRSGGIEVTLVSEAIPPNWQEFLATTHLPGRILTRRPPAEDTLANWVEQIGAAEIPPVWEHRTQIDGAPTAYICRDFSCSPPLTDPHDAAEWIETLSPD